MSSNSQKPIRIKPRRQMQTKQAHCGSAVLVIIFAMSPFRVARSEIPYVFKPLNPARASEINDNFRYLDSAIAKNKNTIGGASKSDSSELLRLSGANPELVVENQSNTLRLLPTKLRWEFSNQAYSFVLADNKLQLFYSGYDGMSYSRQIVQFSEFLVRNASSVQIDENLVVSGQTEVHGKLLAFPGTGFWADSILTPTSKLPSLAETKAYISQNGHLPNVPSAKDVERSGLDLVEMNQILLQKVEELTLHAIAQQEQIEALNARIPTP
jgi:hypothetical protein